MPQYGESFTLLKKTSRWKIFCPICQSKVKNPVGENILSGRLGKSSRFPTTKQCLNIADLDMEISKTQHRKLLACLK